MIPMLTQILEDAIVLIIPNQQDKLIKKWRTHVLAKYNLLFPVSHVGHQKSAHGWPEISFDRLWEVRVPTYFADYAYPGTIPPSCLQRHLAPLILARLNKHCFEYGY
jgi:hypothetical protein